MPIIGLPLAIQSLKLYCFRRREAWNWWGYACFPGIMLLLKSGNPDKHDRLIKIFSPDHSTPLQECDMNGMSIYTGLTMLGWPIRISMNIIILITGVVLLITLGGLRTCILFFLNPEKP